MKVAENAVMAAWNDGKDNLQETMVLFETDRLRLCNGRLITICSLIITYNKT